ncbi:hypothetical protein [Paenibacillus sp. UNC451MF]|uniref:hypothetical protein n=1 Tax=Paenibacillus sp. UNC451MF TaxID=1449063 RepID=UPI00048E8C11|nr:hypothetical protein [Paenibacillus sp. UNC451MF]
MAYIVCSNCNEENPETAAVCGNCSHPLLGSKVLGTRNSEKTKTAQTKFCSHCSEKLEEGSYKCRFCGHMTVTSPAQTSYRYYSAPSSDNGCAVILLFIVTFIIPIVGLIVGGIFALNDDPDKSSVGKGLLIFGLVMIVIQIIVWNVFS